MGRLQCGGETVLDLYSGIGYYTLPFLCKAGMLLYLYVNSACKTQVILGLNRSRHQVVYGLVSAC